MEEIAYLEKTAFPEAWKVLQNKYRTEMKKKLEIYLDAYDKAIERLSRKRIFDSTFD
jgi:predicted metal-dependent hydrolase